MLVGQTNNNNNNNSKETKPTNLNSILNTRDSGTMVINFETFSNVLTNIFPHWKKQNPFLKHLFSVRERERERERERDKEN